MVTVHYLVVNGDYCSLLVDTARYRSSLLVHTFSINATLRCFLEGDALYAIAGFSLINDSFGFITKQIWKYATDNRCEYECSSQNE